MFRRQVLTLLDAPVVARVLRRSLWHRLIIFMFHRFEHPDRGIEGHDPGSVRTFLENLRATGYELISLREGIRRLEGKDQPLKKAVAFTIDDGYADHAEVAAPLFAAFDCPVTTFVTTGFLDGELWLWWDQVRYVFENTDRKSLLVELPDGPLRLSLADQPHARSALPRSLLA